MPLTFRVSPPEQSMASVASPRLGWSHWVLYVIIALGCCWRCYDVWVHNPMDHIWSDPQRHWDHAKDPLMASPMVVFDPPVYQIWLSVVQKFTLGIPELIAIYASLLSVVTPWCWYRFLREYLSSRTLALVGWALFTILPSWFGIYSYFMTETLFLPLLGVSLWMTVRATRKRTTSAFMVMVGFWTLTGLTRGIAIPLAGVSALLVWLYHPQKLRSALWSAVMVTAVLAPLAYRNHHLFYLWAPHGNGWLNKIYAESGAREIKLHLFRNGAQWEYGFGSPSIDARPFEPLSDWTSQRAGTVDVTVDFTQGTKDWKTALDASAKHGIERWHLHVENLIYLFFANSWPDNNPDYLTGRLANLSRWLWAPAFLLMVVASAIHWREVLARPYLPLLIAVWLFFQGWMLLVPNEGRYRKPLEGLLIVQMLVLIDSKRRRSAAAGGEKSESDRLPLKSVPASK